MAAPDEHLIRVAFSAARETANLADELRHILDNSLPRHASAGVRGHLQTSAARLDSVAKALNAELDRAAPDPESLGLLAKLSRRGVQLLLAGGIGAAILGGAAEGLSSTVAEVIVSRAEAAESKSGELLQCLAPIEEEGAIEPSDGSSGQRESKGDESHGEEEEAIGFFPGGNYRGQDFAGVDLSGVDLAQADFSDSDLTNADLSSADLSGATLRRAILVDARLDDANLTDARLYRSNASGASFRGADLTRAELVDMELSGADFTGAELASVDLTQSQIDGVHGLEHLV